MSAHSTLGASSAKRWTNCPGSVKLIEQAPKSVSSSFAIEGTGAHGLGEQVLRNNPGPAAAWYIGRESEIKDFPAGLKITEEMADHVQDYVDFVRNVRNALPGSELLVEHRFKLTHLHPKFWGTCDAIVLQHFGELHVFDFKYGAGVQVGVEENEQLMFYALGALELGDFSKVVLHVYQPRAGGHSQWETTPERLLEFGKYLRKKALETEVPNAPLVEGEHCQFCPAQAICTVRYSRAVDVAKSDFANVAPELPKPTMLTAEQIAKVMQYEKQIRNWLDAVKDYALSTLNDGGKIDGLKLVRGRGRREWKNFQDAEKTLRALLGDAAFESKILSVAKAEKLLGPDLVDPISVFVEGSVTVAHESDRRKSLAASAADDFK